MYDFATVGTDMTFTFYQAAIVIKISNLLVSFCSFDLTCAILEKKLSTICILYCLDLLMLY